MNRAVISLGSNSDNREWQMSQGIMWINELLSNVAISTVYNTAAVNGIDADYLNSVVVGDCNDSLDCLTMVLKKYEQACGRTSGSKSQGIVPMDMDIVIWNGTVVRQRDFKQLYFQTGWRQLESKDINL